MRSSSPSGSTGSTFASFPASAYPARFRCRVPESTTSTSRPTATTRSRAASSRHALVKIDITGQEVVSRLSLPADAMPQDVKLAPDGRLFYVADSRANGVWEVDGNAVNVTGFLRTGRGAHGLYVSRNARLLYVTNRLDGSISVVSFRTKREVAKWRIPGGGSPDMGNVSADGRVLWLSGRYDGVVYAISTKSGRLLARIPVGAGPHGLCVWPQPGRHSLGHTGILR